MERDYTTAIQHLNEAVAIEDTLLYMEPPDWMQPARHTLGTVLLDAGQAADAERVYREDLKRWPENERQGKTAQTKETRERLDQAAGVSGYHGACELPVCTARRRRPCTSRLSAFTSRGNRFARNLSRVLATAEAPCIVQT
ncbi:MAG: hypothetical protein SGJ11_02920 [Phycisphaerae bacterium]|nr:hypothetical protein [Phycisphaerae bacterium]